MDIYALTSFVPDAKCLAILLLINAPVLVRSIYVIGNVIDIAEAILNVSFTSMFYSFSV